MLVTLSQHPAANLCKFHRAVTKEPGAGHGLAEGFEINLRYLFAMTYKQSRGGGRGNSWFFVCFFSAEGAFFSTTISTELAIQISLFLTDLAGNCRGPAKNYAQYPQAVLLKLRLDGIGTFIARRQSSRAWHGKILEPAGQRFRDFGL